MINREHKDRLFKIIFGRPENREWTLSLYNAVNGSAYEDASQIEYNTMDDVLYMGMKNDLSFILDNRLHLYGHQSSFNPNMPVRCLLYLAWLWSKYLIGSSEVNIYGRKQIKLPAPKFVVFYNGKEEEPDEKVLRLRSAFPKKYRKHVDVELRVRMVNINAGHSTALTEKCKPLYEYCWLVDKIRENHRQMPVEEAVDKALRDMPEGFGIRPYLIAHREEVRMSILTEYDEEKTMRLFAAEAREEGLEEGRKEGLEKGREEGREKGLAEGREKGQATLIEVIIRLRKGESREAILASGVDERTLELAESVERNP
ncbi:MAG: hypothetical protein IJ600_06605 [Lachnospiraceae bacterium]|nr:hypothetical protein [Lachnospiraceae bacterium]